jgi:hypothetical protein
MPLADVGVLAQLSTPISGRLGLDVDVTGTRAAPLLTLVGAADSLRVGGLAAEAMRLTGRYAANRAAVELFPILLDMTHGPGVIGLFPAGGAHMDLRAGTHGSSNYSACLRPAYSGKLGREWC